MDDWLNDLAVALGVDPLTREESGALLKLARDVAHGVERRFAPLSAFLLGAAAGARDRGAPFEEALRRAREALPEAPTGDPPAG